ncbi:MULTISPECIES: DNA primase [unclassified Micromonospora]|uniref:DNA primase n=1 Tax=unclassified Micromonospora TaxID=2617518 RepID=UPI00188F19A2|nr:MULTISPECIES: DNA primase [unclassified Micromonospora]MBF5028359.1 DNA primase [Micromonospora sp. ANENR4]MCZ7473170.1 DNA primase [Micromonospora sp. WMMC273]WBC03840.1 DNA primase [Micromonospora sp. WMMA1976]
MARQSPQRPDADEPELDDTDAAAAADEVEEDRPPADRALWEEVRIDPVEIALPAGTGFTLRAYRPARELTPTDVAERDQDDPFLARRQVVETEEDEEVVILDEEFAALSAEEDDEDEEKDAKSRRKGKADASDEEKAEDDEDDSEDEDDEDEAGDEEVPLFLTHKGRLLLFKTPESLVTFIRSGAPNDLSQLDSWNELSERLEPADIAPLDEDTYELDLVVENLRGGHDAWDHELLIEAGEIARDLAYALRLPAVLDMLSAGSSLDDLDEALRASVNGGVGGFLGRRRLKKIGAQTASLGWRTIVGKISAVVDWRD